MVSARGKNCLRASCDLGIKYLMLRSHAEQYESVVCGKSVQNHSLVIVVTYVLPVVCVFL